MSTPTSLNVRVTDLVALLADLKAAQPMLDPVLLDVREAWELGRARLEVPGARLVHIPLGSLSARWQELDPDQPVFTLCHHGMRSWQALMFLRQQGLDHVFNIADGIDAWSRQVDPAVPRY